MNGRTIGWLIVGAGALLIVLGFLVLVGGFSWFGRMPGDLRLGGDRVRVFIPITSMLLISIVLSLLLYVARRLFGA